MRTPSLLILPLISQPGCSCLQPSGQSEAAENPTAVSGWLITSVGGSVGKGLGRMIRVWVGRGVGLGLTLVGAGVALGSWVGWAVFVGLGVAEDAGAAVCSSRMLMLVGMIPWRCRSAGEATQAESRRSKMLIPRMERREIAAPFTVLVNLSIQESSHRSSCQYPGVPGYE